MEVRLHSPAAPSGRRGPFPPPRPSFPSASLACPPALACPAAVQGPAAPPTPAMACAAAAVVPPPAAAVRGKEGAERLRRADKGASPAIQARSRAPPPWEKEEFENVNPKPKTPKPPWTRKYSKP